MMADNEIYCAECKKKEVDPNKVVTCLYCFSSVHFKCRNIIGNAVRRVKESPFFCSSDCAATYQRIIEMKQNDQLMVSALASELKKTIATEMESVRYEVKLVTSAIEASQEFLSAKFDDIVSDFSNLKAENEILKQEIEILKKSNDNLTGAVHKLEINVDKTNKLTTSKNLMIFGVPIIPNENVSELVAKIFTSLGLSAETDAITSSSRIFTNIKSHNSLIPIRVIFKSVEAKEEIFNKKKLTGQLLSTTIDPLLLLHGKATTISIRDELTPLSLEIMKDLRESQTKLKIKYICSGRGGVVLVKIG